MGTVAYKLFDIYYEYSGINNLATVNRCAGQEPIQVDQKLIDFLLYAKEIYNITKIRIFMYQKSFIKKYII